MELTLGEIFGNGMFVFAFTSGIVAILYPFSVDPAEHTRDCLSYLAAILVLSLMMSDGIITAVEGLFLILAYSAYVVLVLNFDTVKSEPESYRSRSTLSGRKFFIFLFTDMNLIRPEFLICELKSHVILWSEYVAQICGQNSNPKPLNRAS